MGNDTVQLTLVWRFVLFVVTLLALAGTATVTTPAAHAQTPGCDWPYTNNMINNGRFETADWSEWHYYGADGRVALTDHPCGWGWGYSPRFITLEYAIQQAPNKYVSVSFWHKQNTTMNGTSRSYVIRNLDGTNTDHAFSDLSSGWNYQTFCLPPTSVNISSYRLQFALIQAPPATSEWDDTITGIFVAVNDSACVSPSTAPVVTPTPIPTATATPIPTATPNYGRIKQPVWDLPVQPPTGGGGGGGAGVDLGAMGLPPLPMAEGLLGADKAPEGAAKLNAVFGVDDLGTLVGTAREVTTYLFSTTIWRLLLFFTLVGFAARKVMQFHSSGSEAGASAPPTHINNRR
jgi:hypothetical protein